MKLIIWDFDGTLADTRPLIEAGMDHALKIVGLDPNIKQLWLQHVGLPLEEGVHAVFGSMKIKIDSIIDAYQSFNYIENEHLVKGFKGIDQLLEELKHLNISMAIASSKRKKPLERQLKMLGWEHYFYPIITPNDVRFGKPNPESVYKCLLANDAKSENTVVIGDTEFDLDMARQANVASIAVCYGFQSILSMSHYSPIACVDNIVGLRDAILKWGQICH
jgi:HAD superfamily hydrolase (TIGR01549 family)